MTTLDRTSPEEAVEMYLKHRQPEVSQKTLTEHKYRLTRFLEWDGTDELRDMTEMTRKVAAKYRFYRTEEVAPSTLENEIRTFRLFIRFCEDFGCVPEGVAKHIDVPTASKQRRSRSVKLEKERGDAILNHLEQYEYASFRHVLFYLTWDLGTRISGVRALDVGDLRENANGDGWFLDFVHRPEKGTPLKNGWKSERRPPLTGDLPDVLHDWIDNLRPDVEDEHGRSPLIATKHGRAHSTTIRDHIYAMTRPCWRGEACPHDDEPDPPDCEAAGSMTGASKCPSSRSPHALRRGRATANLNDGMPPDMTSDRMDMSPEVLEEHYNEQTEDDKRRLQRQFLEDD
jgi:integrase